jgi:hypothetical protein
MEEGTLFEYLKKAEGKRLIEVDCAEKVRQIA